MSENKPNPTSPEDPLASLHRMSTTAGIASQEYVAVNIAAVAALVLGLAGGLVLMSNILLVLPALAIIFGIVALRQVHNSNGTQTGTGLAILGILAALGIGGFIGVREYRVRAAQNSELAQIDVLVQQLEQKLLAKDYPGALSLFGDTFLTRKAITEDRYRETMSTLVQNPVLGALKHVRTNNRVLLGPSQDQGANAGTMLVFEYSGSDKLIRLEAAFRKTGGTWKIEDIPQAFPAPRPEAGAPGSDLPPGEASGPRPGR